MVKIRVGLLGGEKKHQEEHVHMLKSLNEWPGQAPVQSACCGGCKQ